MTQMFSFLVRKAVGAARPAQAQAVSASPLQALNRAQLQAVVGGGGGAPTDLPKGTW
jgi:hypothetical protein